LASAACHHHDRTGAGRRTIGRGFQTSQLVSRGSTDHARSSVGVVTIRRARSAELHQIQPQRMACPNAARSTVWTRAKVPEASGRPPAPPAQRRVA
jgi:hypothetical protein